jgi:hypothetical protein
LKGDKQGSTFLHQSKEYPREAIAPISFFWRPKQNKDGARSLWIWIHPAAVHEAIGAFLSIECAHGNASLLCSFFDTNV